MARQVYFSDLAKQLTNTD